MPFLAQDPITVIVPAFNVAEYLDAALASLQAQTYREFVALVLDDGSTDATPDIASAWGKKDSRFTLARAEQNKGHTSTRNRGLDLAGTKWVANMDADDTCPPTRLEKQMAHVKAHPELVTVSTQGTLFGEASGPIRFPYSAEAVSLRMLFDMPLLNGAAMLNAEWLNEQNIRYRQEALYAEDYDLFAQIYEAGGAQASLPESLYNYRIHRASTTQSKRETQEKSAVAIRRRLLAQLNFELTEEEIRLMERRQFDAGLTPAPTDLALFKLLDARLAELHVLGSPYSVISLYERARFAVSMMPRPSSKQDKLLLALSLAKISPLLASTFIPLFLLGRP